MTPIETALAAPGADPAAAFEQHRQSMVAHLLRLREAAGSEYANAAIDAYARAHGCPFPGLREDVTAAWKASREVTPA